MFEVRNDKFGLPYWSVTEKEINESHILNISLIHEYDIAHFLSPLLVVKNRIAGPFREDLTGRDDVVLAFLSLILLLIIDGLVTTVLLRSIDGKISNFGFSVKQIVEFIREFSFRRIFKAPRRETARRRKVNIKLLVLAAAILILIFGLEMAVLILTEPKPKEVFNTTNTFRLVQPLVPKWDMILFHTRSSMDRPCQSVSFKNVSQDVTRINVCVSARRADGDDDMKLKLFEEVDGDVSAKITTEMHKYGADHTVTIEEETVAYSTRAYFTLGDKKSRMMSIATRESDEAEQVKIVHNQYIAYLFTMYNITRKDGKVNVETLNLLKPKFIPSPRDSSTVTVLSILKKEPVTVPSTKYTTTVTGRLPRGSHAFRVAQHVFAGSAAIKIADPDTKDLFMETGLGDAKAVVWQELKRDVNWLSLCIIVVASFLILLVLRKVLKPVATAEIAGAFVKSAVGASMWRSPMELSEEEMTYFLVSQDPDGTNYRYGAETRDGWSANNTEYTEDINR